MENFINKLNSLDAKHWCILFDTGMRGNVLVRILAAHQEAWWDNESMNINSDPDIYLPLQLSETQSSFIPMDDPYLDFKITYLAPHTCLNVNTSNKTMLQEIIKKRSKHKDKYFFTISHPESHWNISRFIHIYASEQNSKRFYKTTKPIVSENVINVDISKLFSYDRGKFEEEYCKILNTFQFTPMFASVRSFILQMLDRESSIDKHRVYSKNY